ncbi:ABC transporter ATP-binding protein [Synechococcus elongatus]|uniref:ABC transporter ATP-binding protein n=1 Tax=Synechococcus elongatus PCC 11801 TaxID=2219813 RepID=A0AAN1UTW1_SYNEL|nr:ABC transporter ATP-binding protein [Synechococcus elongatus]AZB71929.1 ABC transporter ATP-binding protein [Synechococcus elongatus PCC 11801]
MSEPLLHLSQVSVNYGAVAALTDLTLEVFPGEIVALIGANGAGKTTTLRAISRLVPLQQGRISYNQQDLGQMQAPQLVGRGLAHCPEGRRVLARQSVRINLELGAYCRRDRVGIQTDLELQFDRFPRLRERQDQLAGTLSGGEQQMLAIARALMSRPRLLLLDEPSLGLAPQIVQEIFGVIRRLREQGMTILLVEQNATLALQTANRGYVLEAGQMIFSGPAADLLADPRVKQAYLG